MRCLRLSVRQRTLVITAITLAALCPGASAQRHPRTVLTIHSGAENYPGTERLDAAIRNALLVHTGGPVDYFTEYLETEEFPADIASTALRDYIHKKYERHHIDVVIAITAVALRFALRYRDELFPNVPIVFQAVTLPQAVVDRTTPGVTGVLNDTPFAETLQLALNLQPSAKRVFVVAQAPSIEGYGERVRSALSRFSNRVELTYSSERTMPA